MSQKTVIEEYMERIYKVVLVLLVVSCTAAEIVYGSLHLLGFYPELTLTKWLLGLGACVCYAVAAFILIWNGKKDDKIMLHCKIYMFVILIIQEIVLYNLYPCTAIWAMIAYFYILAALFLDFKFQLVISIIGNVILAVCMLINPSLLPKQDGDFICNLVIMVCVIVLCSFGLVLITYFVETFLLNAKKDELNRNNNKMKQILDKSGNVVTILAESVDNIKQKVEDESVAFEELNAISEELVAANEEMVEKADQSDQNLEKLVEGEVNLTEFVSNSRGAFEKLEELSVKNESELENLVDANKKVMSVNEKAVETIDSLVEGMNKVEATLAMIGEIANSTNLLALNASIEAARAGEAGKGFAVVAGEIGNLSNNTQNMLKEIQQIIKTVNEASNLTSRQVQSSSEHITQQSDILANTVDSVRAMLEVVKTSAENVKAIEALNRQQGDLIKTNSNYNSQVLEQIKLQSEQFKQIADTVQKNTEDISEISEEMERLNMQAEELKQLMI